MKRLLAMLLCVMQIFGCVPHVHAESVCAACGSADVYQSTYTTNYSWEKISDTMHKESYDIVNVLICNDCGSRESLGVAESVKDELSTHYFINGACGCGATNNCAHENTTTYEAYYNEHYVYVDETYHQVVHKIADRTVCTNETCGEELSFVDTGKTTQYQAVHNYTNGECVCGASSQTQTECETHSWNWGTCTVCGAECEHPAPRKANEWYSLVSGEWTNNNNGTHTGNCVLVAWMNCEECGKYYEAPIEGEEAAVRTLECWRWNGETGRCSECGYQIAEGEDCTHPDIQINNTYYQLYSGSWTCNNDGTHTGMAVLVNWMYCYDCDTGYEDPISDPANHTEDCDYDDGVCVRCGYENPCEHPDEYFDSWSYYIPAENAQWSPNDDGKTHSALAYKFTRGYCNLCSMYVDLSSDEEPQVYSETHYFEDGFCVDCGYENPCEHPDAYIYNWFYFDLAPGQQWTANADGKTHSAMAIKSVGTACDLCSMDLEVIEDESAKLYTEDHNYYNSDICSDCGYVSTCTHPSESISTWKDYELLPGEEWTINSDGTHTGNCYEDTVTNCNLCDQYTRTRTGDAQVRTLPHDFYRDICQYCGAENTCEHPNTQTYTWLDSNSDPVVNNNLTHIQTGTLYENTWCYDCQSTIVSNKIADDYVMAEQHTFSNHVCTECGYQSICDHSNTTLENVYTNGTNIQPKDAFYHTGTFDLYSVALCDLCGRIAQRTLIEEAVQHDEEHGFFTSDGTCYACGYANTCQHKGDTESSTWYSDYSLEITITAENHSYTATRSDETYCADCGVYLVSTETPNVTVTEEHKLNSQGVCIICGYEGDVCTHENVTQTGGNQKNQKVTVNENGTHTRTFDVYWEYTCGDCGEEYETFIEQGSETEAHVAGDNPNVCIVCGSAMCSRHFYRDGKCIRCGYENDCAHVNKTFEEDGRNENTVFVDNLDGTHTRTFDVYLYYACADCEESCAIYEEQGTETEAHEYPNGAICRCGHECPHDSKTQSGGYQTNKVCADLGNGTHMRAFDVYRTYKCNLCGQESETYIERGYETEAHTYNGNGENCDTCGAAQSCSSHVRSGSSLDYEMIFDTPQAYNDEFHLQTYTTYSRYQCANCGGYFYRISAMEGYEGHTYNADGLCACGAEGETTTCTHENTEFRTCDENVVYSDIDSQTHTKTCDVYFYMWCLDCETRRMYQLDTPNVITTENHSYTDGVCDCKYVCNHLFDRELANGLCLYCGLECEHNYAGGSCMYCLKACPHENTLTNTYSQFVRDEEPVDALSHAYLESYYDVVTCQDCRMELSRTLTAENVPCYDPHTFTYGDGTTCFCGYTSTCPHTDTTVTEVSGFEFQGSVTPIDALTHRGVDQLYRRVKCNQCMATISRTPIGEPTEVVAPHEFEDGYCMFCFYVNECAHEEMIQKIYDEEPHNLRSVDNETHAYEVTKRISEHCAACNEYFFNTTYEHDVTVTKPHVFDDNGTCLICQFEQDPSSQRHYYRDGVCIECGHENSCAHTNAVFAEDGRQKNTVFTINNDGTHTRTFDVYHFYDCPDCNESYAIYMEQGTETEAHEYPNGANCQCGKLKPCDTHDWVALGGECPVCGEVCLHPEYDQLYSTYYELADGEEWIDDLNGLTHTANAVKVVRRYCPACAVETEVSRDEAPVLYSVNHSFLSDGFCYHCGYECPHDQGKMFIDFETLYLDPVSHDKDYHKNPYTVTDRYKCNTCRKYLFESSEVFDLEIHHYDADGLCYCGHEYLSGMNTIIRLPSSLKTIEAEAFAGSAAEVFIVPDGCTEIGSLAFAQNTSLKLIVLPASVTNISADAFTGCENVSIISPFGCAAQTLANELGLIWHSMQ